MIYIYFYCPKGSRTPEIVGSLIANNEEEFLEIVKKSMPEQMKEKGYEYGGSCMDESATLRNQWDLNINDLSVRRFDICGVFITHRDKRFDGMNITHSTSLSFIDTKETVHVGVERDIDYSC